MDIVERLRRYSYQGGETVSCPGDEIAELITDVHEAANEIKRLRDIIEEPTWVDFIKVTRNWLTNYPQDIFTGVSGDPGPLFVVAIRGALEELDRIQTTEQTTEADKWEDEGGSTLE